VHSRSWIALLISGAVGVVLLAACGAGPTTTATNFTPSSLSIATSAPLSSTALAQQPVATAVPAPTGYGQSVSAALVTAPANTTVTIKSGNTVPSGIPALSFATKGGGGIQTMSKVRPMTVGENNAVFYTVISPSAAITVAGAVSVTQTFPTGALTSGTNYYLAFYDSTQASPAWQTISGPVTTTDGVTLTFSGTVSSFTLQQGAAYAFCIFSVSGSSTPPPSTNQEVAYLAQGTNGILVYNTSGTLVQTININSDGLGLDDSANIYNLVIASPAPSVIQKFPAGSTTASVTFTGTAASNPSAATEEGFLATSGSGELSAGYYEPSPDGLGNFAVALDVWNAGSTGGAPNYTLTADQSGNFTFDVQHDGTIYFSQNKNGIPSYLVFPPGSSTVSRTVPETYVTGSNLALFSPNYMTVGADGTLYVTEYTFVQPDPLCGLYIYPPSGSESFVALDSNANGCGAFGVDVDAVGNIYVAVNNSGLDSTNSYAPLADTLNEVEVFAPGTTTPSRRISVPNPVALVTAPDGTLFISSFITEGSSGTNATFVVAPGSTTATKITSVAENSIVLYNGYQESATALRRHTSFSGAAQAARGGAASLARFLKMTHRGI